MTDIDGRCSQGSGLKFIAPTRLCKGQRICYDLIQKGGLQQTVGGMRGIGTCSFFVSCREKHSWGCLAWNWRRVAAAKMASHESRAQKFAKAARCDLEMWRLWCDSDSFPHSTKQMLAKKWVGTFGLTCDVGKEQLGDAQPVKILGQARFCALHSWAKASWTSINLSFLSASQISWCWSGKQCWWFFSYQTFSAASLIPNSEFILYASVQNLWAHVSFFCRYQSQLALKLKQVTTSLCCDVPRQSIRDNPRWGHWSQVISRVMMSLYRIQTHALKDNTWEDWHALSWNSSNQLHI